MHFRILIASKERKYQIQKCSWKAQNLQTKNLERKALIMDQNVLHQNRLRTTSKDSIKQFHSFIDCKLSN